MSETSCNKSTREKERGGSILISSQSARPRQSSALEIRKHDRSATKGSKLNVESRVDDDADVEGNEDFVDNWEDNRASPAPAILLHYLRSTDLAMFDKLKEVTIQTSIHKIMESRCRGGDGSNNGYRDYCQPSVQKGVGRG